MPYSWVLFDADHTLFDFERSSAHALGQTLEQHGVNFEETHHVPTYKAINKRYWQALERGEIDQAGLRVARFSDFLTEIEASRVDAPRFSEDYEHHLGQSRHLLDGATEIVEHVAARASLMMITNGLHRVQQPRLSQASIAHHFEDILISEELGVSKPDPRIFDIAFDRMGQPEKSEVLMVGDSLLADIGGGANAGIDTCWFNPTGRVNDHGIPVTHEIRNLAELASICS